MPRDDNDTKCTLGGASRRWNDLYVGTGVASIETDLDLNGNTLNSACFQTNTAANIADVANVINTTEKNTGKMIWDTTNNRLMVASGALAASPWYVADGSASVTPA